jgi:hypothetical protein
MEKIDQALFGYSSGHRILASSVKLSTTSLRLMEILSDLSGNDTSENFDGYYTGCWLPDDNCYAISKTWYATEMQRPGCAWTHTLFFKAKTFSTSINIPIDLLFKRPNIININELLNKYKIPIEVELEEENKYFDSCYALWLFQTIISNKESVAICHDNVLDFNLSFELIFKLMGVSFFKNFSFCTGSQTNRMIKDKPLNLQVMPTIISKVVLRSLTTISPLEKKINNFAALYTTNLDDLLKVKKFALRIDEMCYSFEKFLSIQEIYYVLYKDNRIDLPHIISIIQDAFTFEQSLKIFTGVVNVFVEDIVANNDDISVFINLLFSISTIEEKYNRFIISLNTSDFTKYIFEFNGKVHPNVLRLISKMLVSELNNFGEEFLKVTSLALDSNDLIQLLSDKQTHCIVLMRYNWKLAENKVLWKMALEIQYEMIKNISHPFNKSSYEDKDSFSELLFIIFENGSEEVSDEIYAVFGDFSITTYFMWIKNSNSNKSAWISICKNNPSKSLSMLNSVSNTNTQLFYSLLKVINPWDKTMFTIKTEAWEELYNNYCKNNSNTKLNDTFAKFMLQVMINTNIKLSDTFAHFVFMTVHKNLGESDFDNVFWNKIASYLPEVKWYNSWDKCKRLRKYAMKIGYTNIFQ